jgi:hypothetical protein
MKLAIPFLDLGLAIIWLFLFRYCQKYSTRDPSSYFFDPERAYEPAYSAVREKEADDFIARASTPLTPEALAQLYGSEGTPTAAASTNETEAATPNRRFPHRVCVGIPSIQREQEQFLQHTVGSLVDTVGRDGRRALDVVVLLADAEPPHNAAFGQPWLSNLADEVLTYAPVPDHLAAEGYRRADATADMATAPRDMHVQLDYASLVDACRARGADYFLLVEDDIVASRDWFDRLQESLTEMEDINHASADWLYLRLFYTELYLGWNSEEWPRYIAHIAAVYVVVAAFAVLGRRAWLTLRGRRLGDVSIKSLDVTSIVRFNVWVALFVALFFMAGRQTVVPRRAGVQEMQNYGCCAQGLTFPQRHLEMLSAKLRSPPHDIPGDSFVDVVAADEGLKKWAVIPSVFQHAGTRGTSAPGSSKKLTWNFGFEDRT